jgi:hypothetical protein
MRLLMQRANVINREEPRGRNGAFSALNSAKNSAKELSIRRQPKAYLAKVAYEHSVVFSEVSAVSAYLVVDRTDQQRASFNSSIVAKRHSNESGTLVYAKVRKETPWKP